MLLAASFLCGFVFGLGLLISGLMQPAKVLAFLDVFGAWDPSLLVVMAAALAVSSIGFALAQRRPRPLLSPQSYLPTSRDIDRPLVIGSALFGVGWGLVGLCPGPALANLATLSLPVVDFVVAMMVGIVAHDAWRTRIDRRQAAAADG
jgi:hypothetical protein